MPAYLSYDPSRRPLSEGQCLTVATALALVWANQQSAVTAETDQPVSTFQGVPPRQGRPTRHESGDTVDVTLWAVADSNRD
jgi:D-alanyl-D-alanine dipeptidase